MSKQINREDILRMVGMRDSAGLMNKVNSLMIDMYDEGGKLAEYSTQIIRTSKNITLLAQRVTDDEQSIADLTVKYDEIDLTVKNTKKTVDGHEKSISQLTVKEKEISQKVTVIEGDYVKNAQISLMVTKDANGYLESSVKVAADQINFVFEDIARFIAKSGSTEKEVMNIDPSGNLWISGEYRGGTITDNVTIGTGTNNMVIRPRGTNGAELVGLVNNSTAIRLWFQGGDTGALDLIGSHFSASYWDAGFVTYRTGYGGGAFAINMDGTGKIHIGSYANQGSMAMWPTSRNDVEIGQVFLGDDEILRVKTA